MNEKTIFGIVILIVFIILGYFVVTQIIAFKVGAVNSIAINKVEYIISNRRVA